MPELQIIGVPQSNYVWATRIACAEKGVPHSLLPLMAHTQEVYAISPFGKIPVMRHGDIVLAESKAICTYVDRRFDGPPLIPADPLAAAQVEQWVSAVNTSVDPVCVRQYLLAHIFPGTPDGSPNRALIDAAVPKVEAQIGVLDRAVAKTGHLVGDQFTLADINLLPILFYLSRFPESGAMVAKTAALAEYLDRHGRRTSVLETVPPPLPKG